MGFNDIFKKNFLEGVSTGNLTTTNIVVALAATGVIALYIFLIYKIVTRKTFYSKSFNVSLVALALITAAIILTIQSSVVISLGMVGALSIVRFRTAIKEPMDLVFLFWAISAGIICGAGLFEVAFIVSAFVSAAIFFLELFPTAGCPKLLVINGADNVEEKMLGDIVRKHAKSCKLKAHTISKQSTDIIYELKIDDGSALVKELGKMEEIFSVSLMTHDGEVTY